MLYYRVIRHDYEYIIIYIIIILCRYLHSCIIMRSYFGNVFENKLHVRVEVEDAVNDVV